MSIIIVATLLVVMVFAFSYYSIGPLANISWRNLPFISNKPFFPCFERSFMILVTLSNEIEGCQGDVVWIDKLLTFIQVFFGLFFFASIVAFFTGVVLRPKKIFELKPSLNISQQNGRIKIVCSAYNASPVPVTNLNVQVIARARVNVNTLKNIVLFDGPPVHPLAEPYIPLRIYAELSKHGISVTDVDGCNNVIRLSYQRPTDNKPLSVEEIYVDIGGVLLGIEQTVHAQKRYIIKDNDLFYGKYNSFDANYNYARQKGVFKRLVPPKKFNLNFESNNEPLTDNKDRKYVFGFGSLVDPSSFSKSIKREEWFVENFPLATLKDYKRVWDVAMDNDRSILGYKRYKTIEEYPHCFVTFLNIKPSETDEVIGTIVEVNKDEFALLIKMEKNYFPKNVTESIVHSPIDGSVFAFIGTSEAKKRFNSRTQHKPAVISKSYFELVENAYRSRGKVAYANYLSTTEKDDSLKLQNLEKVNV